MSLATAIRERDREQLPSRRDEDWRWSDIRGLIRELPAPSPAFDGEPAGPFHALAGRTISAVNPTGGDLIPVDAVVAVHHLARGGGAQASSGALHVPDGQAMVLLESYAGDERDYLASRELTISLGRGARLERIVLAEDGGEGVRVVTANVVLAPEAHFAQTVLTSGARRQRIETRIAHPGGHAAVRLDGVYLLAGKRHADQTSVVEHEGVDGVTSQLAKGVVADQARGVFQGRIVVAEGADRTDARMGHHALVLSDRAEVDARPELEIYADDVACAHGNTVGALDEEALFYARQRGIPEAAARALLMEAFVGEVVERIGHDGAREVARAWVAERLRG